MAVRSFLRIRFPRHWRLNGHPRMDDGQIDNQVIRLETLFEKASVVDMVMSFLKLVRDMSSLIAVALLVLMGVATIALWFLDLLAQQRGFGLLLSAELVAFATLVYIYMNKLRE